VLRPQTKKVPSNTQKVALPETFLRTRSGSPNPGRHTVAMLAGAQDRHRRAQPQILGAVTQQREGDQGDEHAALTIGVTATRQP